ncbi:MAG: hypothetical protein IH621_12960 [Krumholzibacteria bacterium]|nr:hypothetical protein [Candidatus Krumholzibacteria bacterium]
MGRLDRLPPYLFSAIDAAKAAARAAGRPVVDLGIGDPDRPTPPALVEVLARPLPVELDLSDVVPGEPERAHPHDR